VKLFEKRDRRKNNEMGKKKHISNQKNKERIK
jgi:hypothetical protein